MRYFGVIVISAATFIATGCCQTTSPTRSCDSLTEICYSSFTNSEGITYGIALPQADRTPVDAILQIVAPIQHGWVGIAWAGQMTYNPLTVAWPSGNSVMVSSRWASGLNVPQAYSGADYTYLRGTGTNSTHWTLTVRCRGCSEWLDVDGSPRSIDPLGTSDFAWAYATGPVSNPTSNTSVFQAHDNFGYWTHNLSLARDSRFDSWVSSNTLIPVPTTTVSSISSTATSTTVAPGPTGTDFPAACAGVSAPRYPFLLASGWRAVKVAGGLTVPRGVIRDPLGRLLIVENGRGVSQHTVAANGCILSSRLLISQTNLNHGIYLSSNGTTLYASSATTVWSWSYDLATGNIQGSSTVLITGMYGGGHVTRTLLIPPHRPDLLLVSHGSDSNFDYPSLDPAVGRSIVKVFDLTAVPPDGYNYARNGYVMGYGLRNEVGLVFDGNNMLWGIENSGDNFARTVGNGTTDIHIDNPADELNYLGDVAVPNENWYGYPTCYTVWEPSVITDRIFSVGDQFVVAPNATFNDTTCAERSQPPRLGFQAHSAPLDGKFDTSYTNLFVTLHGSWNRQPPTGYKLVVVPFSRGSDGGYVPTASANSSSGYQDIFYHADVSRCSAANCTRPVALTFDPMGRLYMTSDASQEGEVFMLTRE